MYIVRSLPLPPPGIIVVMLLRRFTCQCHYTFTYLSAAEHNSLNSDLHDFQLLSFSLTIDIYTCAVFMNECFPLLLPVTLRYVAVAMWNFVLSH